MLGKYVSRISYLSLLVVGAFRERDEPTIKLVTGSSNEQQIGFSPKASFAEYVELPTQGDQLRITLANFNSSCDDYASTPADGIMVVLTLMLPAGQNPMVGTYPWPGLPANVSSATDLDLKTPIVIPVVRQGPRSATLLPGGSVDIQHVSLERQGEVTGVMRLEQSGGDGRPPTRLFGTFAAKVCRTTNQAGNMGQ